jgi:glycosyltransferase involved in cell wall biosynthesis
VHSGTPSLSVFYLFTDSDRRRSALQREPGSAERYCLFGLDQLVERGARAAHNLDGLGPSPIARRTEVVLNRWVYRGGGFGGEFATVISSRPRMNAADVVFATVDSVATPAALLKSVGFVRRPLVYGSVGLLERLARLRGERTIRFFAAAIARAAAIVAYSEREAELLRDWFSAHGRLPRVVFCPFGVDTEFFRPVSDGRGDVDVVSIGADPHRDFPLLLSVSERHPDLEVLIVASRHSAPPPPYPRNVKVELDIPFEGVRSRLASAKVVALPVEANTYSGATTVLLQAMAMGKPVVASRTEAIATGYGLVDGENCRLVEPGDSGALEAGVCGLLGDEVARARLGTRARETVEHSLSWQRYADSIRDVLEEAATGRQ